MKSILPVIGTAGAVLLLLGPAAPAAESIWIESEHLRGVRGTCFPDMGHKTAGHWAMSGPGIAPELTQVWRIGAGLIQVNTRHPRSHEFTFLNAGHRTRCRGPASATSR